MRTNRLMATRGIPEQRGAVIVLGSILIGLVLASFIMMSPLAGALALSCGTLLAVTVFLRRSDYLIFGWFVLTSLIYYIMVRFLPPEYYEFVGRGIFWGLLGCVIAAWAMDNVLRGRRFTPFDDVPITASILIFVLWSLATLFTSIDVFHSVKKLSHIVIALITSYMFYDFFSRDSRNIAKVLTVVSLVVAFVSLATVALAIQGLISGIPIYKQVQLWFHNPNILGKLLFTCSPVLITSGFYFGPNNRLRFLFVFLMLLALYFSFSRTSWLALLVSVSYLFWKGRTKSLFAVAIVAGLFLAGLTFPMWGEKTYNYAVGPRYTGRNAIWQGAWSAACEHPMLGVGPGNSKAVLGQYIDHPFYARYFVDTHSLYLQNAVDMGFMSVVLMLAFCAILLYSSMRIEKNLKSLHLELVVRGATATFLGLLVHGIFETGSVLTAFDAAEFHVLFPYILMALPFAAKRLEEKAESEPVP